MKNVIALIAFLFIGFAANAQATDGTNTAEREAKARAEKMVARMKEKLQLTADQEKAITPVMVKHYTDMDNLKKSATSPNPPTDMQKAKADIRRVTDRELNRVLTPEQMVKYKEMMKKRGEEGQGK